MEALVEELSSATSKASGGPSLLKPSVWLVTVNWSLVAPVGTMKDWLKSERRLPASPRRAWPLTMEASPRRFQPKLALLGSETVKVPFFKEPALPEEDVPPAPTAGVTSW